MTFKAFIKKEWLEAIRDNRLIVLFMGFLFFAISTPPMLKMLPDILAQEYGAEMSSMFKTSAIDSVGNFILSNFPQVCMLVLCLSLGGILSNEVSRGTIILPLAKGANKRNIVLAKFSFYAFILFLVSTISVLSNIYYSYIVFETEFPQIFNVLLTCFYIYLYTIFVLALVFLFSSFMKKGTMVALVAMGSNVLLTLLKPFEYFFNPYTLVVEASKLNGEILFNSIFVTVFAIGLLVFASIYLFSKQEVDS